MLIKINNTDYLVGTIHLVSKEFKLPPCVVQAAAASTKILVEADVSNITAVAAMLPEGQTLIDVVSPRIMGAFNDILDLTQIPYDAVKGLKPWAVQACIANTVSVRNGFHPARNLDGRLAGMFAEVIEIEGVSQVDTLEKAMAALSEDEMVDQLNKVYEFIPRIKMILQDIEKAVLAGDYDTCLKNLDEVTSSTEANKIMITDRNKMMVDVMERHLDSKCLTAVGAAHLGGEDGIINLLRQRGYEVQ